MTDVVSVAFISAGAALVTALVTQYLATRAASKQADRADRREALQWQRSEALRLEELARETARQKKELQDAHLRELWGHVLDVRWQILDTLERVPTKDRPKPKSSDVSAQSTPVHAAGKAYSVALISLAAVRPSAKAFYAATGSVQLALQSSDGDAMGQAVGEWNNAYKALENSVIALTEGLHADMVVSGNAVQ